MNAQASRHIRHHTIKWSRNHDDTLGEKVEYDEKLGSGRGWEFVRTLEAGDRITLVARALVCLFPLFVFLGF
jgi:hypothetical protein